MSDNVSTAANCQSRSTPACTPPNRGSFRPDPPENCKSVRKPQAADAADEAAACRTETARLVELAAKNPSSSALELCGITPPVERGVSGPPAVAGRQPPAAVLPLAVRHGLALLDDAPPAGKRGGRPKVIDDFMKARITTLMATGFSLRQTAGLLGVSRSAVSEAVAADPELQQEIEDARQRAQMHPLAAIVRESGRNWKAAVWLINYLERAAVKDQTREERNRQEAQESANFLIQTDMASEMRAAARDARRRERQRAEIREEYAAERQSRRANTARRRPAPPSPNPPPPRP